MGLNALVYVSRDHLTVGPEHRDIKVDEETGEILGDEQQAPFPREAVVAVEKRLGNAALIIFIHDEIERLVEQRSMPVILEQVLYDGTHSGDYISLENVPRLRQEITFLIDLTRGQRSAGLDRFLGDLQELVRAAEVERNPIVFV